MQHQNEIPGFYVDSCGPTSRHVLKKKPDTEGWIEKQTTCVYKQFYSNFRTSHFIFNLNQEVHFYKTRCAESLKRRPIGGREPLKRRTAAVNHLEAVTGSPTGLLSLDPQNPTFGD